LKFSDLHYNVKLLWADMQQFGCLMCELYLCPRLYTQTPGESLQARYNAIAKQYTKDPNTLPR